MFYYILLGPHNRFMKLVLLTHISTDGATKSEGSEVICPRSQDKQEPRFQKCELLKNVFHHLEEIHHMSYKLFEISEKFFLSLLIKK